MAFLELDKLFSQIQNCIQVFGFKSESRTEYIDKKLKSAKYKVLEDNTYFGEIPEIKGVWANSKKLEDCRDELAEVLEEWNETKK